eukprot:9482550-Pyramimonas_sp.AAC.1
MPTISLTDILEGRLTGLQVDDGNLFGLEDYVEVSAGDLEEAARRKSQMADCIKDTCTKLFGELKKRAEEHKTAHKEQQERLAHKRRRQGDDGGDG